MSLTQERGAGAAGAALETGVMQMPSMRLLPTQGTLYIITPSGLSAWRGELSAPGSSATYQLPLP